jgi:hypothetical protein
MRKNMVPTKWELKAEWMTKETNRSFQNVGRKKMRCRRYLETKEVGF